MPLHIRGPAPAHLTSISPPKRPPTAPDTRDPRATLADTGIRAAGKAVLS